MTDPEDTHDLHPGRVALHDDGIRKHIAIIVECKEEYTKALFFTSNPEWQKARKAKNEELAHVGYLPSRATYLTGVTRRTEEFQPMASTVPEAYVVKYAREFEFASEIPTRRQSFDEPPERRQARLPRSHKRNRQRAFMK